MMDDNAAVLRMKNTEHEEEIAKFVAKHGEDAVLDAIGLEHVIINARKRISPFAAPLNDTPERLAKNIELRFVATKMLDHTLGIYEGLSKLVGLLPKDAKL